jgi:hypothetical protein
MSLRTLKAATIVALISVILTTVSSVLMAQEPAATAETQPAAEASDKAATGAAAAGAGAAPESTAEKAPSTPPKRTLTTLSDVDFKHLSAAPELNWGFNPFLRKPGYAVIDPTTDLITPDKFKLDAIIYEKDDPLAIVNDHTVGVGDHIDGMEIEEIAPNYVTLRGQGLYFELAMPPARETASTAEIEPVLATPKKEKSK